MNENERRNEIWEMKLKEGRNINVGMKDDREKELRKEGIMRGMR